MKTAWAVGFALALGASAQGKVPAAAPDVTVCVAGGGALEPATTFAAKDAVTRIFDGIGVRLAWATEGKCGKGTAGVVLRVRIATEPAPSRFPGDALAYARPYAGGSQEISVFWSRIRIQSPALAAALLAEVMAHEIAHVLQGVARHSTEGLMKAHWDVRDYLTMQSHPLTFTAEDADLVRSGLERLQRR